MVLKRTQRAVDDSSKHWYQDKYQHVLVQRNVLALVSLAALACAFIAVLAVMHFAPLKSVEPYLLQVDDKTGITQKVDPISRDQYAANEAIDHYFTSLYIRSRENYNATLLRTSYNQVRLMSTPNVFYGYRNALAGGKESLQARMGATGTRDVHINSMSYLKNPPLPGGKPEPVTATKIIQVRFTSTDAMPGAPEVTQQMIATIEFEYASLDLSLNDQLLNPLGYTVVSYQIQREG